MNRQAQAVLLALLGGAVLYAGSTDLFQRYVKTGLRPLLLGAGIVLIAAAAATVWYEWRASRNSRSERGHDHRERRISWLLVVALFALVLIRPPALDSYSGLRAGTAVPAPFGFPALPAAGPLSLGVLDYAGRAIYDHGRSLQGRQIELTGFVAVDQGGAVYLIRMILNCCAADAQPVKVGLTGQVPPVLQPDTWLDVTGTYTGKQTTDPINNGAVPFIDVQQARPVPAPSDPYESMG
ncbi:TIGR03943 family protein [Amycolatopsis sp. NBC_01488]|uniref:TIGR03943 family putative permease subunit n=1 Tax=Amycolatopsis sp. NBC_01488 TaxID=2903563 RepID=UPI002E2A2E03|nr:TIGR03943 family protein [Amycolatopsis sp. NBC_01488]